MAKTKKEKNSNLGIAKCSAFGLEMHLNTIHRLTDELKPRVVVVDTVTNFGSIAPLSEIKSMLTRLIDYFKMNHVTPFFTSLTEGGQHEELSDVDVSSFFSGYMARPSDYRNRWRAKPGIICSEVPGYSSLHANLPLSVNRSVSQCDD